MKKIIVTVLSILFIASCAKRESKEADYMDQAKSNIGFRNAESYVGREPEGATSYEWSGNAGLASNASAINGAYNVEVTDANGATANEPVSTTESSPDVLNSSIPRPIEQKLIKDGNVSFKVKSLKETRAKIQMVVSAAKGYVANESSYGYQDNPSEQVVIRVPASQFDKVLAEILSGAEKVDSKNVTIEDVTEEYVDIEARLKNKRQLEERYQALLAKAVKVEDMLKIEREISIIRQEIEASEGRMRYLNSRVGYSTITLNYYERKISGFNFGGKLAHGMENGGEGLLYFIIGFCSMWPMWLVIGILWFLIARWIRKRRNRKQAEAAAAV